LRHDAAARVSRSNVEHGGLCWLAGHVATAFAEFFFSRARDVYPKYDFARMDENEFGATAQLD